MASLNSINGVLGAQNDTYLLKQTAFEPRLQDTRMFINLINSATFQRFIQFKIESNLLIHWVSPNTNFINRTKNIFSASNDSTFWYGHQFALKIARIDINSRKN